MIIPPLDDYYVQKQRGNDLERGGPKAWNWTRNGGEYSNGRDFFSVHWEVHLPKSPDDTDFSNVVRLHIEAPRFRDDPTLNSIKREVVQAILAAELARVAARGDMDLRRGTRTSIESIQANKCTEPFRVVLSPSQTKATPCANMECVHEVLWPTLSEVLTPFCPRLERLFGRK